MRRGFGHSGRCSRSRARLVHTVSGGGAMEPAPALSWMRRLLDWFSIPALAATWAGASQQQRYKIAQTLGVPLRKQRGLSVLETRQAVHAWVDGQRPVPWDPFGQTTTSDVLDLAAVAMTAIEQQRGAAGEAVVDELLQGGFFVDGQADKQGRQNKQNCLS